MGVLNTMIRNGYGGANTVTGITFENLTNLHEYLSFPHDCFYPKHKFIKWVESTTGKHISVFWSKKLYPDEAIILDNDIFIIEKKYQQTEGSVDEKLQTCDFKKKQYEKIGKQVDKKIHFCFLLNDWFKQDRYTDVLEYIRAVQCDYFFNTIPVSYFTESQIDIHN